MTLKRLSRQDKIERLKNRLNRLIQIDRSFDNLKRTLFEFGADFYDRLAELQVAYLLAINGIDRLEYLETQNKKKSLPHPDLKAARKNIEYYIEVKRLSEFEHEVVAEQVVRELGGIVKKSKSHFAIIPYFDLRFLKKYKGPFMKWFRELLPAMEIGRRYNFIQNNELLVSLKVEQGSEISYYELDSATDDLRDYENKLVYKVKKILDGVVKQFKLYKDCTNVSVLYDSFSEVTEDEFQVVYRQNTKMSVNPDYPRIFHGEFKEKYDILTTVVHLEADGSPYNPKINSSLFMNDNKYKKIDQQILWQLLSDVEEKREQREGLTLDV